VSANGAQEGSQNPQPAESGNSTYILFLVLADIFAVSILKTKINLLVLFFVPRYSA